MREFLAAALTVIAMGVLLIAYTLSGSRVAAAPGAGLVQYDGYQFARPASAAERVDWTGDPYAARTPNGCPVSAVRPIGDPYVQRAPAVRRVSAPATRNSARLESRGRDWKQIAMILGGSTAAGAGIGAVVGGKKGALIGAALGGGASTLYEATRR